jgi:hypothetical protein
MAGVTLVSVDPRRIRMAAWAFAFVQVGVVAALTGSAIFRTQQRRC